MYVLARSENNGLSFFCRKFSDRQRTKQTSEVFTRNSRPVPESADSCAVYCFKARIGIPGGARDENASSTDRKERHRKTACSFFQPHSIHLTLGRTSRTHTKYKNTAKPWYVLAVRLAGNAFRKILGDA